MQADGNLVVYSPTGTALWSSWANPIKKEGITREIVDAIVSGAEEALKIVFDE
jgi:hypothetical protein